MRLGIEIDAHNSYVHIFVTSSKVSVLNHAIGHGHVEVGRDTCVGVGSAVGLASV